MKQSIESAFDFPYNYTNYIFQLLHMRYVKIYAK